MAWQTSLGRKYPDSAIRHDITRPFFEQRDDIGCAIYRSQYYIGGFALRSERAARARHNSPAQSKVERPGSLYERHYIAGLDT